MTIQSEKLIKIKNYSVDVIAAQSRKLARDKIILETAEFIDNGGEIKNLGTYPGAIPKFQMQGIE